MNSIHHMYNVNYFSYVFYFFMSPTIYKFFSSRPKLLKNGYREFLHELLNIPFPEIVKTVFFLQISCQEFLTFLITFELHACYLYGNLVVLFLAVL